ncbi:MAG: ABC transporter permease [Actinomycetota bacterium]
MNEQNSRKMANINNKTVFGRIGAMREIIIFGLTIILFAIFFFTTRGVMFAPGTLKIIFVAVSELGIVAIGMTMLIICGEFDLSVGSISAMGALVAARLYQTGLNPFLALVLSLIVGIALGAFNGFVTVKFNLPSFIVTLATMIGYRGLIYVITEGVPIGFRTNDSHPAFHRFLAGNLGLIPIPLVWLVVGTVILILILNYRRFGNHVYAVGGNKETARAMGINIDKTKIICFMTLGMLSALAGVMRVTRVRSFHSLQGESIALLAIAAAVIGGTLLQGGVGTVLGTVLGTIVIVLIEYGLIMSGVGAYIYNLVLGGVIIVVVILNNVIEQRRK